MAGEAHHDATGDGAPPAGAPDEGTVREPPAVDAAHAEPADAEPADAEPADDTARAEPAADATSEDLLMIRVQHSESFRRWIDTMPHFDLDGTTLYLPSGDVPMAQDELARQWMQRGTPDPEV